ncbi:MAG: ACT domain-containing protein [Gammaproteobacteria bacterium]
MTQAVISVLGQDRPGIIATVSEALLASECNIEGVSQTLLRAVFGALFVVAMPDDLDAETLAGRLAAAVEGMELDVIVHAYPATSDVAPPPAEPFVVTTHGPDRRGAVAALSGVLARHGVNVTDLQAVFEGGERPESNVMIFQVDVPDTVALPDLKRELGATAERLGIELNIQHRRLFEIMNRV